MRKGTFMGRVALLVMACVASVVLACVAPQARALAQEGGAIEVVDTEGEPAEGVVADSELEPEAQASVSYRTHVQTHGWQAWAADGQVAGTSGESKRLEAIELRVDGASGGIEYRTHVQTYGWQAWRADGQTSGTSGESKRLEAIEIRLTGELAETHDVWYRVHAQTFGWMGWAKDGERAGTATMGKRLEAIQVVLVAKGGAAPGNTFGGVAGNHAAAYETRLVQYRTHVQTHGWQAWSYDGEASGTCGQSKRLEALEIKIADPPCAGGVEYRTHVQTYGWQGWVADGQTSGTSGQSKRLEAVEVRLTGEMAERYDVFYRVHAQTFGWMGWAANGDTAGTEGYGKRLEAIQVVLVSKGGPAPGSTEGAFRKLEPITISGEGWKLELPEAWRGKHTITYNAYGGNGTIVEHSVGRLTETVEVSQQDFENIAPQFEGDPTGTLVGRLNIKSGQTVDVRRDVPGNDFGYFLSITLKNGKVLLVYSAIPYLGISPSDARVGEFLSIATEGRMTSYSDLHTGTIKDGNDVGYFRLCQYSAELIAKHLSVE